MIQECGNIASGLRAIWPLKFRLNIWIIYFKNHEIFYNSLEINCIFLRLSSPSNRKAINFDSLGFRFSVSHRSGTLEDKAKNLRNL